MRPAGTPYTRAQPNQRLFHQANKIYRAQSRAAGVAQAAQIEDGVSDELSRPVVGHVAAAIDLVQRHAARGQQCVGGKHVGAIRIAPQSQHRRMLEQQQHVLDAPLLAQRHQLFLQAQRLVVTQAAEIEVLDHVLSRNIAVSHSNADLPGVRV